MTYRLHWESLFQVRGGKPLLSGKPYEWIGYACGTFLHRGIRKHNGIKQEKLDGIVIDEVMKLANESARKAFYKQLKGSKKTNYNKLLIKKKGKLGKLQKQFSKINSAYQNGVDTLEEYSTKKSDILPKIEELKEEISKLSDSIKNPKVLNWQDAYEEVIRSFIEHPTAKEKKKVKMILSRLIERVEFRNKPFSVKVFYRMG